MNTQSIVLLTVITRLSLRDQLHTRYSSSTKSKKKRRLTAQGKLNDVVVEIMHQQGCAEIVARLKILSCEIDDDGEEATSAVKSKFLAPFSHHQLLRFACPHRRIAISIQ